MGLWVGEGEIVELMVELVRCPSVNPPGKTRECAELILDRFAVEGIDVEIIEGAEGICNAVARLPGREKGKVLLLNGHMDVVPPGNGWTVDPFGGEIRDGKIYGRGTCDMKSGLVSMVAAMIGFKRSGTRFNGEILFTVAGDEETGSEFGTQYLLKKGFGKDADFAIVSEPTSLRVALGNRGLRWIDMVVKGVACHAGRPHLGVNAIDRAAKLIGAVHSMRFQARDDFFEIPIPTISVTMIHSGTKVNIIPERCDLSVDRRMMPGETTETVMEELKRVIDPILGEEEGLEILANVRPIYWDPYVIAQDEPIVQATVESIEEITGERPAVLGKAACTDASHIFHMGGIPTIILGPGNESLAHKADECVEIEKLVVATDIFMSIFERLLRAV